MKKTLLPILTLAFIALSFTLFAQDPTTETLSKDELKLKKLEDKIVNIENKILLTEAKIDQADSLINKGFEMANESNNELKVISGEEKMFVKDNSIQRKGLLKQLKKADEEDEKDIESELKVIEKEYTTQLKVFDKRYSAEEKKLTKAKSNNDKGKEKLKQYNPKLKEYQKQLEIAKENLEVFKSEKNM